MKNLFAYTQENRLVIENYIQEILPYNDLYMYIYTNTTNPLNDNHLNIHLYQDFYLQIPHR